MDSDIEYRERYDWLGKQVIIKLWYYDTRSIIQRYAMHVPPMFTEIVKNNKKVHYSVRPETINGHTARLEGGCLVARGTSVAATAGGGG